MRVLITGGAGFIGRKLAHRLLAGGTLMGRTIEGIVLADVVAAEGFANDKRVTATALDITDATAVNALVGQGFDAAYHLAAVVSGEAEADYDKGMSVNLDGTLNVLAALRALGTVPRLIFSSSVAVFGGPVPTPIGDDFHLTPQTSYGSEKAAGELLVADASRKGFVDGRSLRLPTICVRPGKPNKAASSFASSIVREPLSGQEVVCPVGPEAKMFILSPRRVVDALVQAMEMPSEAFGQVRSLTLPGLTYTQAEMMAALKAVAGQNVVDRVKWEPDAFIQKIVAGWPQHFATTRAEKMGFKRDANLEEIIRAHIEDELGGDWAR